MDLTSFELEDLRDLKFAVELAQHYALKLDQPLSYGRYTRMLDKIDEAIKDVSFEETQLPLPVEGECQVTIIDRIPY